MAYNKEIRLQKVFVRSERAFHRRTYTYTFDLATLLIGIYAREINIWVYKINKILHKNVHFISIHNCPYLNTA